MDDYKNIRYQDLLEIISETYNHNGDNEIDQIVNIYNNSEEKYYFKFYNGTCSVQWGFHPLANTSYYGSIDTFINILRSIEDPVEKILNEEIKVEGDIALFTNLKHKFISGSPEKFYYIDSLGSIYRGAFKIPNRIILMVYLFINLSTVIISSTSPDRYLIIGFNTIPVIVFIYLLISNSVRPIDLYFTLFNLIILTTHYFNLTISNRTGIYFIHNFYMLLLYSFSFLGSRTVIGWYNTININGVEYIDKKINSRFSDITILWVLLNIVGITNVLIPVALEYFDILTMNIYILLYIFLSLYTYLELESC